MCHLVQHPQSFPECVKVCDEERPMVLKGLQAGALAPSSPLGLMLLSPLLSSAFHTFIFALCHNMESGRAALLCVSLGDPGSSLTPAVFSVAVEVCRPFICCRRCLVPLQNGDHSSPPDSLPHRSRVSLALLPLLILFFRSSLSRLWQTRQSAASET